jgi:hypothetical protein
MVGEAKGGVMLAEQINDLRRIPAWVTEFESVAVSPREHLDELSKPVAIRLELRRQLKQHRAGLLLERLQPGDHEV